MMRVASIYSDNRLVPLQWKQSVSGLEQDVRYGLAFSGGCDSSFLLASCVRAGYDVKAYMVDSQFQGRREVDEAKRIAAEIGADLEVIRADILADPSVASNGPDRCYWCKRFIFRRILDAMQRDNRCVLLDGTNASDDPFNRPGFRALKELKVVSPLRETGFCKCDVRDASAQLALSTADKPSFSCLATKVSEGTVLTADVLAQAERNLVEN